MIREANGVKWVCFHDTNDMEYAVRGKDIRLLYQYKDVTFNNCIMNFISIVGNVVASVSKEVYEDVKKDLGLT